MSSAASETGYFYVHGNWRTHERNGQCFNRGTMLIAGAYEWVFEGIGTFVAHKEETWQGIGWCV